MKKPTKPKRKHFFLVKGSIFPFDTLFTTACIERIIGYIENKGYKLNDNERESLELQGNGKATMLLGGQTIIRIKFHK